MSPEYRRPGKEQKGKQQKIGGSATNRTQIESTRNGVTHVAEPGSRQAKRRHKRSVNADKRLLLKEGPIIASVADRVFDSRSS